jgi:hypothetical protein
MSQEEIRIPGKETGRIEVKIVIFWKPTYSYIEGALNNHL